MDIGRYQYVSYNICYIIRIGIQNESSVISSNFTSLTLVIAGALGIVNVGAGVQVVRI